MSSSQQKKPKPRSESLKRPSDDGPITTSSLPSEHQEITGSTASRITSRTNITDITSHNNHTLQNTSVTVACPPSDKKMTSNARSNTCKKSSLNIKSSPISHPASTSNAKDCIPFWKCQVKAFSKEAPLWLPIETDSPDLHSNWWKGSFNSMASKSWFSMKKWKALKTENSSKIYCPSSTYSIAESMENENTAKIKRSNAKKKPPANKCRKIRLSPCPEVQNKLRQWFGSVRVTYNWALGCIKNKPHVYSCTNMISLRKRFINACNIPKSKSYLLDTPKHVRDTAMKDLTEAYKSNFEIRKKNPSHTFDLKFRSKKDTQSITIPYTVIKDLVLDKDSQDGEFKMYPTFLKNKIKFHMRKNRTSIPRIDNDCKLIMDKLGRFTLAIPFYEEACDNQASAHKKGWAAIDTGVRTMLTVYSPTWGECYKIGDRDISKIFRLCKHLDKLIGKKRVKKKKRAIIVLRKRIRDLVTELHCKAIVFLLNTFDHIIIPPFNVSHMVKKGNRKLTKSSVRKMLTWRHYDFKMRLKEKALRCGVQIYERGEEYTSKTCTHCMNIKHDLGGAKVYRCDHCRLKVDRDVGGSRNIFIKNASECGR